MSTENTETAVAVAPTSFAEAQAMIPATHTAQDFSKVAKVFDVMPYVQMAYNNDLVNKHKVRPGHFCWMTLGGNFEELGENVLMYPFAWRPCALDSRGEKPKFYYNENSKEFQDLFAIRDVKDSKVVVGPQFLCYLPGKGFFTFFMGSKSARNESPALLSLLPGADGIPQATLMSPQSLSNDNYSWLSPKITKSSQELALPDLTEYADARKAFMSPKDSVPDVVATSAVAADRG